MGKEIFLLEELYQSRRLMGLSEVKKTNKEIQLKKGEEVEKDKKKEIKEGIFDKDWTNRLVSIRNIYNDFKNTGEYQSEDGKIIKDIKDLIMFLSKKFDVSIHALLVFLKDFLSIKHKNLISKLL